ATGHTISEIAQAMNAEAMGGITDVISEKDVRAYLGQAMDTLGASELHQLVHIAYKWGLVVARSADGARLVRPQDNLWLLKDPRQRLVLRMLAGGHPIEGSIATQFLPKTRPATPADHLAALAACETFIRSIASTLGFRSTRDIQLA